MATSSHRLRRAMMRGFSLVEILVVVSIIAVLMSLLLPAIMASKSAAQKAECVRNLHQIGIAYKNARSHNEKVLPSSWIESLKPFAENQDAIFQCMAAEGGNSYGMNGLGNRFGPGDSHKILVLDYKKKIVHVTGDYADEWDENVDCRHNGYANCLYLDGHVRSLGPTGLDLVNENILASNWTPRTGVGSGEESLTGGSGSGGGSSSNNDGNCGPPGLIGNYRFNTADQPFFKMDDPAWVTAHHAVTRVESSLSFPYGKGKDYNDPAHPYNNYSAANGGRFTCEFIGQIKADYSEDYRFYIDHDDGCLIQIDGRTVHDKPGWTGGHNYVINTGGSIAMQADYCVNIYVRVLNDCGNPNNDNGCGGWNHLNVQWESASTPRQDIPATNLFQRR